MMTGADVYGQSYQWTGTPPGPESGNFTLGAGPVYYTPVYTVTNTGADTQKVKIGPLQNNNPYTNYLFQSLTFQWVTTKVSGTMGGSVFIYASADTGLGTSYPVQVYSVALTSDSVQSVSKVITGNPYTNYWIITKGTGTEVFKHWESLLTR